MNRIRSFVLILLPAILLSCGSDPVPRPRAYFRISMPEKQYQIFDTTYPYSFEYPVYSTLKPDTRKNAEAYWADLEMPLFGANIYLSYKPVQDNLDLYIEDAHKMAMKHLARSTGIQEMLIHREEARVYGLIYNIRGSEAASPYQFFLTDSTTHFLRGALYFYHAPNNDSLAPVIDFLEEDILHLIETLDWK